MKKQILKLIIMAVVITLMLACIYSRADDNDGWIIITIDNMEDVPLEIYLIATGDYGDWTMLDEFNDITVFIREDGSTYIDKTLSQIRQRIDDRRITPIRTGTSDQNGKIEFKDLPRGIYYVMMRDEQKGLKISPMLLSAPNKAGSVQIRAIAKYEYVTPTPSPTPTPKPTMTPYEPPETTPTPTPTPPPVRTVTPTPKPTQEPTRTPAPPTQGPVPTPSPIPDPDATPIPPRAKKLEPKDGETVVRLEDYETALGLGNIQMHVGVCFD